MNSKKRTLIIMTIFLLIIILSSVLYSTLSKSVKTENLIVQETMEEEIVENSEDNQNQEEVTAPDFMVYDALGNAVYLSDFFGKPIILNFWASWCGPCKSEMPHFESIYQRYKNSVHFLMVNLTDGYRETTDKAMSYIASQSYNFPVYYDNQGIAAYVYQVQAIPTTYFINQDGHVVAYASGAIDEQALQVGINYIIQ